MDLAAHQASSSREGLTWRTRPLHLPAHSDSESRLYTALTQSRRRSVASVHRSISGPNTPSMVEPRITIPIRPISSRHASSSSASKSPRHKASPSDPPLGAYAEPSSTGVHLQGAAQDIVSCAPPMKRSLSSIPNINAGSPPRKPPTKRKRKSAQQHLPASDSGPITMTEPEEGMWIGGVWVDSQSKANQPRTGSEVTSHRQPASEEVRGTNNLSHRPIPLQSLAKLSRTAEIPRYDGTTQAESMPFDAPREERAEREDLQRPLGRSASRIYSDPPSYIRMSTSSLPFTRIHVDTAGGSTEDHSLLHAHNGELIGKQPAMEVRGEPDRDFASRLYSRDDVKHQVADTTFARLQSRPVHLDYAEGYRVGAYGTPPEPPAAQPSRSQRGFHSASDPYDAASPYDPWPEQMDPNRVYTSNGASYRGAQDGREHFVDRPWALTHPSGSFGRQAAAELMHHISQTNGRGWASDPVESHTSKYPMSVDTPSPSPSLPEMPDIVSGSPPPQLRITRPPQFILQRQTTYSRRRPRQYIVARSARRELDSPLDDGVSYSYGYDRRKREGSTSLWPISDGGRNEILVPASAAQVWGGDDHGDPPIDEADAFDDQVLREDALFSIEAYERRRRGHQLRHGERNGPFVNRFEIARQVRERDLGDRFHLFDPASQDEARNARWARERAREFMKPLRERFDVSAYAADDFPEPHPAPELRGRRQRLVMGRRNDGGIRTKRRWRYGSPSWGLIQREPPVYRLTMTGTSGTREHLEEYMIRLRHHSSPVAHVPAAASRSQLKRRRSTALVQAESIPPGTVRNITTIPFDQAAPLLRHREEEAKARMAVNSGLIRAAEKSMRQANLDRASKRKKGTAGGRYSGARHDHEIHSPLERREVPSAPEVQKDAVESSALSTHPQPIMTRARKTRIPQLAFTSRDPDHLRVKQRADAEPRCAQMSRAGDTARDTPGSTVVSAQPSGDSHNGFSVEGSHASGLASEMSTNSSSQQIPQDKRAANRSALSLKERPNGESPKDFQTTDGDTEVSQARTMTDSARQVGDYDEDNLRVGPNYVRERAERVRKDIEERARIEREEYLSRLARGASGRDVLFPFQQSQTGRGGDWDPHPHQSPFATQVVMQTQHSQNIGGVPTSGNVWNQDIDAEFERLQQRVPSVQASASSVRPRTRSQTRSASGAPPSQQTRESSLDRDLSNITASQAEVFAQEYLSDDRSDHLLPAGEVAVAQPAEGAGETAANSEHPAVQARSSQHKSEESPSKATRTSSTANINQADKRRPLQPLSLTSTRVTGGGMIQEEGLIRRPHPQMSEARTAASKMSGVQMTKFLADLLQQIPLTKPPESNPRRQSRRRGQEVQQPEGQITTDPGEDRQASRPFPLADTNDCWDTDPGPETGSRDSRKDEQHRGHEMISASSPPEGTMTGTHTHPFPKLTVGQVFKTPERGSRRPSHVPLAVKRDNTPPYIILSDPQAKHLEPWYAHHRWQPSAQKTPPRSVSNQRPKEVQADPNGKKPPGVGLEDRQQGTGWSDQDKKTGLRGRAESGPPGLTDGSYFSRYIVDQGAPFGLTPPSYHKSTSSAGGVGAHKGKMGGGTVITAQPGSSTGPGTKMRAELDLIQRSAPKV